MRIVVECLPAFITPSNSRVCLIQHSSASHMHISILFFSFSQLHLPALDSLTCKANKAT